MKVLIADDNPEGLYLLEALLKGNGYRVTSARNGAEALEQLRRATYDLIITDILMPKMDGFQLCREVKADSRLKDIPFVFYTATYTTEKDREFALSLGASRFIVKPTDPEEFIGIIRDLLAAHGTAGIEARQPSLDRERDYLREYTMRITRKLEDKLREVEAAKAVIETKEQEWQETFDAIGDCVTIHDRDFHILLANTACEKLFGKSGEQIRSRKCYELFHRSAEPHQDCPRLQTDKTGRPSEAEFFEPTLNRWLSVSCFPLFSRDGDRRGVVHFARDITERKRAEEQLQIFRAMVDRSVDAFFVIEPSSGRFIDVDEQACRSLDYSRDELLHLSVVDVETMIPAADAWRTHVRAVKEAGAVILEGEHRRKDGTVFPVEISVSYVSFMKSDYMVAVVRDITERKQAEEERTKLEELLRHAQKMEAVGQLAGGVAHDFNNILTTIIGYANLVEMKLGPEDPLRQHMGEIISASERAAKLTHSLLAFSRRQISNPVPTDLNDVVRDVEKLLRRLIGEDIELRIVLPEEPLTVMADPGQIGQVLMNLATNGRDAMPEGGIFTIHADVQEMKEEVARLHGLSEPGVYAVLRVSDTGTGMDDATRQRIFEPFFTTKALGRGTGLGLAMVYSIIKQHRGNINCYSEPDVGTTFTIYLPLSSSVLQEQEREELAALLAGTETILLAEDDEAVRTLARTVLEEFGYRVIMAADGDEAVELFQKNDEDIDLVILDVIMPKKNGREAYAEILRIRPNTKVLFMSGYTADIMHHRGIIDPDLPFIPKPAPPRELLKEVRKLLDS